MAEETAFTIGTSASCSDGECGELDRIIFDPDSLKVTHLVIEPKHHKQPGRLVPVDLVDTSGGELRLRCTIAEFDNLDLADEAELVEGADATFGVTGVAPMGIPGPVPVVFEDVIPVGETELAPGDPVHCLDGEEVGQVHGFLVDPDEQVTHVLLKEGHFWGRKEVAIPISAVTGTEDGIRVNLTKQQVEDLPPAR
jgi:sporulation protein YlmC with PRC-barrel domain